MSKELCITTLEELKQAAVSISSPIKVCIDLPGIPVGLQFKNFDPTYDLEEVHHCYRELFGVIAFIDEDEVMYAIPACDAVRKIMVNNHFINDFYMRVPFIYGYPVDDAEKWAELLAWRYEEAVKDRTNYRDENSNF